MKRRLPEMTISRKPHPEKAISDTCASVGAIRLRRAEWADTEALFQWRNHDAVRRFSLNSDLIDRDTHCTWFRQALSNPSRVLLIGEREAGESACVPIGVLRYDLQDDYAVVSIYLVPEKMGQGHGTPLLQAGSQWMHQSYPALQRVFAEVRTDNSASIKIFEKAGYQLDKDGTLPPALRVSKVKPGNKAEIQEVVWYAYGF
jgi:RimJ/RimL family protein N-acetyltransferase